MPSSDEIKYDARTKDFKMDKDYYNNMFRIVTHFRGDWGRKEHPAACLGRSTAPGPGRGRGRRRGRFPLGEFAS